MSRLPFYVLSVMLFMQPLFCLEQWNNTLLIIHYNHSHYESIPFLKEMYGTHFPHIVIYGPDEHQQVHKTTDYKGYYVYRTVAEAMETYPDFGAYLYINDDVVLNYWNLYNYDRSKIWTVCDQFLETFDLQKGFYATQWGWWSTVWGYSAIKKSYEKLPQQYKKRLVHNLGDHAIAKNYADMAFIPRKYKDDFITVSKLFAQDKLFLELAIPTIFYCIADKSDIIFLKGEPHTPTYAYKPSFDFFHPVKFSVAQNRDLFKQIFKKMTVN